MKSTIYYHRPTGTILSIVTGLVVGRKESVLSKEFEDVIMTCSKFRGTLAGESQQNRGEQDLYGTGTILYYLLLYIYI